jgi:hypothetical protein
VPPEEIGLDEELDEAEATLVSLPQKNHRAHPEKGGGKGGKAFEESKDHSRFRQQVQEFTVKLLLRRYGMQLQLGPQLMHACKRSFDPFGRRLTSLKMTTGWTAENQGKD